MRLDRAKHAGERAPAPGLAPRGASRSRDEQPVVPGRAHRYSENYYFLSFFFFFFYVGLKTSGLVSSGNMLDMFGHLKVR